MEDRASEDRQPDEWKELRISVRPETAGDAEFVLALYLSVRWEELAVTNWSEASKQAFLASQFHTQSRQYAGHYPCLERWIVEVASSPAGRLYLLCAEREIRVVDISLLPEWRNQGIGSALLKQLAREADAFGRPLRLRVEQHNPALRLYCRLGFQEQETSGPYWALERRVSAETGFSD